MCGIVGYVGKKRALSIVLGGLQRLEYRGYDSVGVLIYNQAKKEVYLQKQPGRINDLMKVIDHSQAGTLGIGHCLHPKTVVQLSNGRILFIKDIKKGQSVINLNSKKLYLSRGDVKTFHHPSPLYLYRVRTAISDFAATENHKTLVYSKGIVKEKTLSELTNKDLLPFPKKINVSQRKKFVFEGIFVKRYYRLDHKGHLFILPLLKKHTREKFTSTLEISKSYIDHFVRNDRNFREDKIISLLRFLNQDEKTFLGRYCQPVNTIHGKHINLPMLSSPTLMQILGYFIGDGYVGERSLRFKDMDEHLLKVYKRLIFREFNVRGKIGSMSDTVAKLLEINSFYLCRWLKKNVKNNLYHFISEIGSLPRSELSSFIKGLFDAEAGVGTKSRQLYIATNNEFLMRSLQLWLLQFGIISSLRVEKINKKQKRKNSAFKLSISNRDSLLKFKKLIGFGGQRKKRTLAKMIRTVGNKHFSYHVLKDNNKIILVRVKGVQKLKSDSKTVYDLEVDNGENFLANGIFTHNSRWATHGKVSKKNSHPHWDCKKKIFVVHNGIIENFQILKETLIKKGHKFVSQTDTEVVPHLIEELISEGLPYEKAVVKTLKTIKGSFALLIFNTDFPDLIVGARLSSPLALGVGKDEFIFASDSTPIAFLTKKIVYLEDGQAAFVRQGGYKIKSFLGQEVEVKKGIIDFSLEKTSKGNFSDFMLKEIFEGPQAIRNTLRGRLLPETGEVKLGGLESNDGKWKTRSNILITGCGTAFFAAKIGEYMFEEYAKIPAKADLASELRYRQPKIDKKTILTAISQSGETADTLAVIKEMKSKGVITLGIVNTVGSSIARLVTAGIYSHVGPEIAVASTKAFLGQVADLALLMIFLARPGQMKTETAKKLLRELVRIPNKIERILEKASLVEKLAVKYQHCRDFLFLGRKYSFPVALEGALKLKEIAYVHAEGLAAGETKHGPIAIIDKDVVTVAVCPKDSVYDKTVSNLQEIKARNGRIIAVASKKDKHLEKLADDVIYVPETLELFYPLLTIVPLHLFAYYFAKKLGRDIDRPRNLAKSVTVE